MTREQLEDIRRTLDCQRAQPAYAADGDITERRLAALDALVAEVEALRRYARAQIAWECLLGTREAEGALPELSAATAALEPFGISHEQYERDLQAAGGEDGDGA